MNRRKFVNGMSVAGLGLLGGSAFGAEEKGGRKIAVFTKFLEKLPYDELAAKIAAVGAGGVEAPLRKGGHIEPEELAEKLPAFVAALAKKDLEVMIMASSINKVDKAGLTERQLRAAAGAGINQYRLQHLRYDLSKPLKPQIANFTAQLKDLAELNKELGIQGVYQNHRGKNYVGGPIWDMVGILEEISLPRSLGMAFDFAHATVEGANAWQMNFRRAIPHIGAVFFKDYKLVGKDWKACPIGEGAVDPAAGKLVSKMLPKDVPISVHVEYIRDAGVQQNCDAMKKDVATVRKWLS
ncbi:MAG: sugar phosphate isomerase/epimerase family protein [Akkermansiaceae bacterium]